MSSPYVVPIDRGVVASDPPPPDLSAWAPLRLPMFRMFWIASLASNLGTWVHEVGAGWLMTTLDASPVMVSAVRTSMALPIVLLAIPAGVLADRIDKRKVLLFTQTVLLCTTTVLAIWTATGMITAWGLLSLTFVIGLGMVLHVPTWQSAVPELVPRQQISRAVGLGSISFNLARAIGPAIGGIVIAVAGVWSAFAINALSFAGVIVVLLVWKRAVTESTGGRSFAGSMRQGVRFAVRNPTLRNVMIGVTLFVLPASALWSLLPLYAKTSLGWGPQGFGILVGTIGAGAVIGAGLLPRLRRRWGTDWLIAGSMVLYAIGLAWISFIPPWPMILMATTMMGAGWMATLTTLNATAQIMLPRRLRARGMGCYLTMMAGSMSLGSQLWGQTANVLGLPAAQQIAAAVLVATAAISLCFQLSMSLDE